MSRVCLKMEKDLEIEMRAKEGVSKSEKLTPFIEPLASSLHNSCLETHCYACFCEFGEDVFIVPCGFVKYCSSKCAEADFPVYFNSGEHDLFLLLKKHPRLWNHSDFYFQYELSYLRLALRLILLLPHSPPGPYHCFDKHNICGDRILGLYRNNPYHYCRLESGAYLIARARAFRQQRGFLDRHIELADILKILTLATTNALPVTFDDHGPIGVALYDYRISWINHSCAPNSEIIFVHAFHEMFVDASHEMTEHNHLSIEPHLSGNGSLEGLVGLSAPRTVSQLLNSDDGLYVVSKLPNGHLSYGPRAAVKTLTGLERGEKVTICYVDSSLPWDIRHMKLWLLYQFECKCARCDAEAKEAKHTRAYSSKPQNPKLKEQEIVLDGSSSSTPQDTDRSVDRLIEGTLGVLAEKEAPVREILSKGSTPSSPKDTHSKKIPLKKCLKFECSLY